MDINHGLLVNQWLLIKVTNGFFQWQWLGHYKMIIGSLRTGGGRFDPGLLDACHLRRSVQVKRDARMPWPLGNGLDHV